MILEAFSKASRLGPAPGHGACRMAHSHGDTGAAIAILSVVVACVLRLVALLAILAVLFYLLSGGRCSGQVENARSD